MSESSKAVNAATAWKLKYINFLLIFFKAYMFERTITPKVFISNDCGSQIQASSETEKNGKKKSKVSNSKNPKQSAGNETWKFTNREQTME